MALLEIENMSVEFGDVGDAFRAVDAVTVHLDIGQVLGVVGESGSGKSVATLALMGLIDYPGRVQADRLSFADEDLLSMAPDKRRTITGRDIAMIFQEPMTSLNPCYTVGYQIMEALNVHEGGNRGERRKRTLELLDQVGIPDPKGRIDSFPHQLSGGMSQRVMIAMAIACNPRLLIADEPTTALDVTIQMQIIDLLLALQRDRGMALILITHDLGLVAEAAERIMVMYAGQIVETGPVPDLFEHPQHPYTAALLSSLPDQARGKQRLQTIPGVVPGKYDRPNGCLLSPRCKFASELCRGTPPPLAGPEGRQVRCHTPLDQQGNPT
jgi:dipeptide transport system ATP-binding protein